ncbi:MAG: fructose-bisphosphatase class III, partial [Spirochaetaceae bacterium]|nr:fructose-bisphosphatase class III [Spirochaetaceae bacterium]
NLPKGTEHFLSDIHGEHEAFDHVIRNASGAVVRTSVALPLPWAWWQIRPLWWRNFGIRVGGKMLLWWGIVEIFFRGWVPCNDAWWPPVLLQS